MKKNKNNQYDKETRNREMHNREIRSADIRNDESLNKDAGKKKHINMERVQAFFEFIGGLIFCALGVFIAIPNAGVLGILWTILAFIITIYNAVNAFSSKYKNVYGDKQEKGTRSTKNEKKDRRHENNIAENNFEIGENNYDNKVHIQDKQYMYDSEIRLMELKRLYKDGLISREEYETKRKKIIEGI